MHLRTILVPSVLCIAACASRTMPGAQPHDMSVTSHEASAAQAERSAGEHASRFDAVAGARAEKCRGQGRAADVDPCWTSETNPTAEHLEHAAQHRRAAADHRAASQALRDGEKRACVGVSEQERDGSPFDHREDIAGVERLYSASSGKLALKHLEGAVVTFRAVPGLTAQWLQRVVDCHLARNAALGHDVTEMPSCPLVPKGARGSVTATSNGFAVAIRGEDQAGTREILRRAETLRPQ